MSILRCNLDLKNTIENGQFFAYSKDQNNYYIIHGQKVFSVKQINKEIYFKGITKNKLKEFFRLNEDIEKIKDSINKDEYINKATDTFSQMRLIQQDSFQCLVSFICSSYSNIPRIRKNLESIRKNFGKKTVFDGKTFYTFPEKIGSDKNAIKKLKKCGLGYRMNYLLNLPSRSALEKLKKLNYEQAKNELLKINGVGDKVADCVLLFSLGKDNAFPIDVWIKKGITSLYGNKMTKTKMGNYTYKEIFGFSQKYFGQYAGWAQQYLFHWMRNDLFRKKVDQKKIKIRKIEIKIKRPITQ